MTLQSFSIIVDIISSVAVFAAIIFGITQIRQFRQQRRDSAAVELVRSVMDSEFTNGFRLIHALPEETSAKDFIGDNSDGDQSRGGKPNCSRSTAVNSPVAQHL